MADLETAKKTADFFAKTTSNPHLVVDANKEGSVDKYVTVTLENAMAKNISLDDKRIVYSTTPVEELKSAKSKTSFSAPTEKVAAAAAKPAATPKPTATKAAAVKKAPTVSTAAEAATEAPAVKSSFTMVSVHNDIYNWFLDHGLTVPQGLTIAQKYHASLEKQSPGTADEKLQRLSTPKSAE